MRSFLKTSALAAALAVVASPTWAAQQAIRVHDLVERADRYGIDLYCPIIYLYTGEPENEAGLRKLVRDILTEFPRIRGYVLLTEGSSLSLS